MRRRPRFGLRWRLLSTIGLVVTATLIATGVFLRVAVHRSIEIDHALDTEALAEVERHAERLGQRLAAVHDEALKNDRAWIDLGRRLGDWSNEVGLDLFVFDNGGRLIAASLDGWTSGRRVPGHESATPGEIELTFEAPGGDVEITRLVMPSVEVLDGAGRPLGWLHVAPPMDDALAEPTAPSTVLSSHNLLIGFDRWLVVGLGTALVLTLLATWWLSRRLLGPLEALTDGARRIADGDLGQRIPVVGDDEIAELATAFNGMAASLHRTEALRRQLVNDVAHELRTPLTRLQAQLEAVIDGLADASPERLRSFHDDTLLLGRMVHDLEELARAEAGQLRLEVESVDVAPIVRAAVTALDVGNGAAITVDLAADLPSVRGDRQRIRQMLDNLLTNARTHTPDDGSIRVSARSIDERVEIAVRDTGPGLDAATREHVFERFYRGDPSRDRATGGAGLGLAIVAQLADLQGGSVRVESRPGEGACFTIALPRG